MTSLQLRGELVYRCVLRQWQRCVNVSNIADTSLSVASTVDFLHFMACFPDSYGSLYAQLKSRRGRAPEVEIANLIGRGIVLATVRAAFPEPMACRMRRSLN